MDLFGPPVVDMSQRPTLEAPTPSPAPVLTTSQAPAPAEGRAAGQRRQILDRLRRGRVNVTELREIACQYNARIFELREAGYDIPNEQDRDTGESWYVLRSEPKALAPGAYVVPARAKRGYRRRGDR